MLRPVSLWIACALLARRSPSFLGESFTLQAALGAVLMVAGAILLT